MNKEKVYQYQIQLSEFNRHIPKLKTFVDFMMDMGYVWKSTVGSHEVWKHDSLGLMVVAGHNKSGNVPHYLINQLHNKLNDFLYENEALEVNKIPFRKHEENIDRNTNKQIDAVAIKKKGQELYELASKTPVNAEANRDYAKFIEINGEDIGFKDTAERLNAAYSYYEAAAEKGDAYSLVQMAYVIYENFLILEVDKEKAIKDSYSLSLRAAEQNHPLGWQNIIYLLGNHWKDLGVTEAEALKQELFYLNKMLDQNGLNEKEKIILNYKKGHLYQYDYKKISLEKKMAWNQAANFYREAAGLGDECAANNYASLLIEEPLFFHKDKTKATHEALNVLIKNAASGQVKIYESLEYILIDQLRQVHSRPDPEVDKAIEWLKQEAIKGNAKACNVYGRVLETSWDKLKISQAQAFENAQNNYLIALEKGDAQACNRLALLFERKNELAKAVSCHIKSIELGGKSSYSALQILINKIKTNNSEDAQCALKSATAWFQDQIKDENPLACLAWAEIVEKSWRELDLYPDQSIALNAIAKYYGVAVDGLKPMAENQDIAACIDLAYILSQKRLLLSKDKQINALGDSLKYYILVAESEGGYFYKIIRNIITAEIDQGNWPNHHINEAINWLKKQAENKNSNAWIEWANLAQSHWEKLDLYNNKKEAFIEIANLFQTSVNEGSPVACDRLASHYWQNTELACELDPTKNLHHVIDLYIESINGGYAPASLNLADLIRKQLELNNPLLTKKIIDKSLKHLELEAIKGNNSLCLKLAEIYSGSFFKRTHTSVQVMEKAEYFYRLSIQGRGGREYNALAKFLVYKASLPYEKKEVLIEEAIRLYILSAQNGEEVAYDNLGILLDDQLKLTSPDISLKKIKSGLEFLCQHTESDDPTTCFMVAYILEKHSVKLQIDKQESMQKAYSLYEKSLMNMNSQRCECLAAFVEENYRFFYMKKFEAQIKAIDLNIKAVELGSHIATLNLLRITSDQLASKEIGLGEEKSITQAFECLREQLVSRRLDGVLLKIFTDMLRRNISQLIKIIKPEQKYFDTLAQCLREIVRQSSGAPHFYILDCNELAKYLMTFAKKINPDDPQKPLTEALTFYQAAASLGDETAKQKLAEFKLKNPGFESPVTFSLPVPDGFKGVVSINFPPQISMQNLQKSTAASSLNVRQPQQPRNRE